MIIKNLLLPVLLFFSAGLYSQNVDSSAIANEYNRVVMDSTTGEDILIGLCTREALKDFPEYAEFWQKQYDTYEPYTEFLETLSDTLKKVKITIVMGTWCGDSKMQVPRFYRIMDELGIPDSSITLICVDRKKKAGGLNIEDYYVEWVPTFIFMKGKVELGRIVEAPSESLENDMSLILTQQ